MRWVLFKNKISKITAFNALMIFEILMVISIDILMKYRHLLPCVIVTSVIVAIISIVFLTVELKKKYSKRNILCKSISIVSFILANTFWLVSKLYIPSTEVNFIAVAIMFLLLLPAAIIASLYQAAKEHNDVESADNN